MTRLLDVLTGLAIAAMVAGAIVLAWRMERGPRDGAAGFRALARHRVLYGHPPAPARWPASARRRC